MIILGSNILGHNYYLGRDYTNLIGSVLSTPGNIILGKGTETQSLGSVQGTSSTLVLTQSLQFSRNKFCTSLLNLSQNLVRDIDYTRTISQTILVNQDLDFELLRTFIASSTLSLSQNVHRTYIIVLNTPLVISGAIDKNVYWSKAVSNNISVVSNTSRQVIFNRDLEHTILIRQGRQRILPDGTVFDIPSVQYTFSNTRVVRLAVPELSVVLPLPSFNDVQSLNAELLIKRSINNTKYTYVRKNDYDRIKYDFDISRNKAYELRNYIDQFLSTRQLMYNWKGEIYVGYITNNPFEFVATARSKSCHGKESYRVTVEFEGVRVH